jgi:hypothetical protein
MYIDYCALNKITIKNRYPLPRIDDLLDQMQEEFFFTKLDFKSSYHQVRIKKEYVWKTTFKRRQGLCEWLVIPFGLCNVPKTFMRLMNDVLHPFNDSFVILYLDDILIFRNTWKYHLSYVKQGLDTLRKTQLISKLQKYESGKTSLIYLRHMIEGGELRVDIEKIATIIEWLIPTNVKKVRSFMRVYQYLRKFIANLSTVVAPLHAITTKGKSSH